MQLRFRTSITCEEYVCRRAWRDATLLQCPLHPEGGCSLARHGTYTRVLPPGAQIARWYCPQAHCTFSLLPDCFASRLSGSLQSLDQVVAEIERASSIESAANALRTDDITLPSAIRWARRRLRLVQTALASLLVLIPECLLGCEASVLSFRERLKIESALPRLREIATDYLEAVPPPLGFKKQFPHDGGPDPPPSTVYPTQRLNLSCVLGEIYPHPSARQRNRSQTRRRTQSMA
jgi:hypothetical protein